MTPGAAFSGGGRSLIGVGNPAVATEAWLDTGGCPVGSAGNPAIAKMQLALTIEGSARSDLPRNSYRCYELIVMCVSHDGLYMFYTCLRNDCYVCQP